MQDCVFIFPGQGSQSLHMLAGLHAVFPQITTTFNEASHVLGYDLWHLVTDGPEALLNDTRYTQPAILTASIALWRIWCDQAASPPLAVAGHSLGEYSALVAAGALAFEDAVGLVAKRGEFMQQAVPEGLGAMAAVLGLSDAEVIAICERAKEGEVLSAVNFNAPGQVVIAGHKTAVMRALQLVKEQGKRALVLPVSVPSHCALMHSAASRLEEVLTTITINAPHIPVFSNVDAQAHHSIKAIKEALVKQLYSPVLWVQTIEALALQSSTFIECGPGKVLTGLNKRINATLNTYPLCEPDLLRTALQL